VGSYYSEGVSRGGSEGKEGRGGTSPLDTITTTPQPPTDGRRVATGAPASWLRTDGGVETPLVASPGRPGEARPPRQGTLLGPVRSCVSNVRAASRLTRFASIQSVYISGRGIRCAERMTGLRRSPPAAATAKGIGRCPMEAAPSLGVFSCGAPAATRTPAFASGGQRSIH
jgi:hypothetical protein